MSSLGLYLHIPFCETKCAYCNFNTYARLEHLVAPYSKALQTEIAAWGERMGRPQVLTIFFGGGTPSWVPLADMESILHAVRGAFDVDPAAEISAEANPGDVSPEKMQGWRSLGINRVSMGVQSFDHGLLHLLTRRHSAEEAIDAFRRLREAGFDNLNIDLMYGLPHQSMAVWRSTLQTALALRPEHISLYALTVEEGTPLWKDVKEGRLPRTDPDAAADMYEAAEAVLGEAGYVHYEISNWALPGRQCRHNLVYWRNEPFLGVGPGAHSYLPAHWQHYAGTRFWNIKSPAEYIRLLTSPHALEGKGLGEGVPVIEEESPVGEEQEVAETMILQLRLDEGLRPADMAARFGEAHVLPRVQTLRQFVGYGLLTESDGLFRLTSRGRLLSNELFTKLLPE